MSEYLSHYPDLVVVGEAANGVDALRLIKIHEPEIIFLDVQMPGLTGLDVLARLETLPLVIFSTAYDQYALEAFELHAVDYLLKPYTRDRFDQAVDRLLKRINQAQTNLAKLAQDLHDEQAAPAYPERIMVPKGSKYIALPVSEIEYVSADGDYSSLHCDSGSRYLSQFGIGELENRLNPELFLRVHRSYIVNRQAIKEAYREGHGYDLVLQSGEIVRVSRGYAEKVKELLF